MNFCYRCTQPAKYRLVRVHQAWWRTLLRLGPREWHACAEHRYDPMLVNYAGPCTFRAPRGRHRQAAS